MLKHLKNNPVQNMLAFATILLVASGLFLRLNRFGVVPVSLYWDEAAMLADARLLVATGKDSHARPWSQVLFPSYGDYKQPVYIWLATLAVASFGNEQWVLRLPSLLAGLSTILCAALLATQLFEKKVSGKKQSWHSVLFSPIAACAMVVVSLSPWAIHFSRVGFEGHLAQAILGFSAYFSLRSRKNPVFLVLAVGLGLLATYTYFSVRFVWPVVFIGSQLLWWPTLKSVQEHVRRVIVLIALPLFVFWLGLYPMTHADFYEAADVYRLSTPSVLNAFSYPTTSNELRELGGNILVDRVLYHRHVLLLRELFANYSDHLNLGYLFLHGQTDNLRHGTGAHGLFFAVFIIPCIVGLFSLMKQNSRALVFLLLWWGIALLPASVPLETPHALRSLNALLPIALIISFGLHTLIQWTLKQKGWRRGAIIFGFLGAVVFSAVRFNWYYQVVYSKASVEFWQAGYREVVERAIAEANTSDYVLLNLQDDRLFLWHIAFGLPDVSFVNTQPTTNWRHLQFGTVIYESQGLYLLNQKGLKISILLRESAFEKDKKSWEDRGITVESVELLSLPEPSDDVVVVVVRT